MKNIVIITAWQRADFLGACLHHIEQAKGWQDNEYLIMVDRGFKPEVLQVAKQWGHAKVIEQRRHNYHGNSFNVLEGYRTALEMAGEDDLIHLIEDDIFIGEGYFDYHRKAWEADPSAFFVTACYNQNDDSRPTDGDISAIYPFRSYQSLGVSLRPSSVRQFIHHNCPAYLRNFNSYLDKQFGRMPFGGEQDGLIQRVIVKGGMHGIYPHVPRAFHAGFRGYNRHGKSLDESIPLTDRIKALVEMTEAEMNERATNPAHKDIRKPDMGYFEPDSLYLSYGLL